MSHRALVLDRTASGLTASVQTVSTAAVGAGQVRVTIDYSDLNYKDALILTGRGYTNLAYPLVPGIDLAGTIVESRHPDFESGQAVVLNGAGLGETRPGGFSETAVLTPDALLPIPAPLTPRGAMVYGTAGLAAAIAVIAIEDAGVARDDVVLVTGAGGGVGMIAVALLAARGYRVTASAGRVDTHVVLRELGASETIGRLTPPATPLGTEQWAAAVDTVGGATLDAVARQLRYGGVVACAGFSGGLTTTLQLAPLLIRAVRLHGVNTSACPMPLRRRAWAVLAEAPILSVIEPTVVEVGLDAISGLAEELLAGAVRGRVLVDVRR